MLKFEFDTSSAGLSITKPINQPVRRFTMKSVSWFGSTLSYTEVESGKTFTIGWQQSSTSWFASNSGIIEVKGHMLPVTLRADYPSFFKIALYDDLRSIQIVWHSPSQYVVQDAHHEIARIYIYRASLEYTHGDTYILTVLDDEADLELLFLYVLCFKFTRDDSSEQA